MELISHRRNTLEELKQTPSKYGVEVDIRSYADDLIIHHDPYISGNSFEEWVSEYDHGTLILNVKEEGLEQRVIQLMDKYGIEDYFFLDQSFPFLIKWSNLGVNRAAVRVSEFETIETALTLAGKVDWVWVDCFTRFPLSTQDAKTLKKAGFKLCLVSPELQGRNPEKEILEWIQFLKKLEIIPDAICTKRPELWEKWEVSS